MKITSHTENVIRSLINVTMSIMSLALFLFLLIAYILIIKKLCNAVKNNTLNHNAEKITIAIVITLILCWPVAIGQGIYVILKWKESK